MEYAKHCLLNTMSQQGMCGESSLLKKASCIFNAGLFLPILAIDSNVVQLILNLIIWKHLYGMVKAASDPTWVHDDRANIFVSNSRPFTKTTRMIHC